MSPPLAQQQEPKPFPQQTFTHSHSTHFNTVITKLRTQLYLTKEEVLHICNSSSHYLSNFVRNIHISNRQQYNINGLIVEVESGNDISVVKWSNNCIFILTNHFSLIPQIINEYCDKKEDKEKTD